MQSSLAPAGEGASDAAWLFWWMTCGSLVVWVSVMALALRYGRSGRRQDVAPRSHDPQRDRRRDRLLIVGAGVVAPLVSLTTLLIVGLAMLPEAVARAPEGSLTIAITGEQWWWRVSYLQAEGPAIALANEVRLPVDEPVQFRLESDNVIHSLWIPSLAGKMDLIPGGTRWLTVRPTETGIFRGACAEYCGTAHALMALYVEVMERPAFGRWLEQQAASAVSPDQRGAQAGAERFLANGCGACHTVRGTPARGVLGPDLTHVGSRISIGAGLVPNRPDTLRRWVASTDHMKPGVHMPAFDMLPASDLDAIAAYLSALR